MLEALPETIGNLQALEVLYLGSNPSLSTLPDSIGRLQMLEHLDVSECALRLLPLSICQLVGLRRLYLSHNALQALPMQFGLLDKLTHLYLQSNGLQILPASLALVQTLYSVNLGDNPFIHTLDGLEAEYGSAAAPLLHGHLFPPSLFELAARAMEQHALIAAPLTKATVPPWIAEYLGCVKSCSWCHAPLFGEYVEYVAAGLVANCHRAPMHFIACGKSHDGILSGGEGFNFYMERAKERSQLEAQASAAASALAEYEAQRDHRNWIQTR